MTDLEKAREALVRRGYPLGGVTMWEDLIHLWEDLIRAVVAEMPAAEVPQPQSVAKPAKRMMRANPGVNPSSLRQVWRIPRIHGKRHEWRKTCDIVPRCEPEPETAKKRTVSAEAREKIVYALWGATVGKSAAEERADRIIAIIEADGAEASA